MPDHSLKNADQAHSIISELSRGFNLDFLEALYESDEPASQADILDYLENNGRTNIATYNVSATKDNLAGSEDLERDLIDFRPSLEDPKKDVHQLSDFGEDVYELVLDYSETVEDFEDFLELFSGKRNNFTEFIYHVDEDVESVRQFSSEIGVPPTTASKYFSLMEEEGLAEANYQGASKQFIVSDKAREVKNFFEDVSEIVDEYSEKEDEKEPSWKRYSLG